MNGYRPSAFFRNPYLVQAIIWVLSAGIFFMGITRAETIEKSALIVLSVFGPAAIAVYSHFYVFDRLCRQKKYLTYFLALVVLVIGFGTAIEWLAKEFVFVDEPDAIIVGNLAVISFLAISLGIRSFFEALQSKNKLMELEAKEAKAELESLKSQVNPHFLFNSLNNIYGLLMEDKERAAGSLLTLSSLLRYLIYASQKPQISLEEEVRFLDDYMAMERLRLGEKCKIEFRKEGDYPQKFVRPFLLIPFVENAFKHGSFATVGESYIKVDLKVESDRLLFSVANSVKPGDAPSGQGTGIGNVKRRLELQMPGRHHLEVVSLEEVFRVKLELEL